MAPYAALQQQSDDYRLRLEYIAYRRFLAMKTYLLDSFDKKFQRKSERTFKV